MAQILLTSNINIFLLACTRLAYNSIVLLICLYVIFKVEEQQILKHCPTRWLSLEKVVIRTLSQLKALKSYFASHTDVEKPGKVKSIHDRLHDPLTELVLNFLKFVLPQVNKFNTIFQSDRCVIGDLLPEMDRVLRAFLVKFVQMEHVKACKNLQELDFADRELQHGSDRIAVGMPTRTILAQADEEGEENPTITPIQQERFFTSVRAFYEAAVRKMVAKFPFDDPILADLAVLDPRKKDQLDYTPIVRLAGIFGPEELDLEELKDEWDDFQLMDTVPTHKDGDPIHTDIFWGTVFQLKTALGVLRFPLMKTVYTALLCLPHSNADSERTFSHVRKINTEYRKTMAIDTLTAFLQIKINCDASCYQVHPTSEMLKLAKSTTATYNNQCSS